MFGYTTTIRVKLYSLIPATLLAVGIALGIGLYVQARFSIGGALDAQMVQQAEFLSEVEPAVFVPTLLYVSLQEAETEKRPEEIARVVQQVRAGETTFRTARENRLRTLPDGEARRLLEREVGDKADEFFALTATRYVPLLERAARKEPVEQAEITRVLREIGARFHDLRRINERLTALTRDELAHERREAAAKVHFWSATNIIVSSLAVIFLVLTKFVVARSIINATNGLNARVRELASGASDLTARIPVTSRDELGQLAEGINALVSKIQGIVGKARESSIQLLSVASEIAATARNQEQTVNNLSASTTQVAASVREISATSKDLSGTMTEVSTSAAHAAELATNGRNNTTKMAAEMKQLVESTASVSARLNMIREKADSINAVVTTITKVADQTNLLSINAAIEAEKAGEYGRGFLVVAREIRRLADQTAVATLDIETMVKQMQDAVSAGVMQMDKFADEVRSGVGQVTKINQMTWEIITEVQGLSGRFQLVNDGMKNQSIGASQINDAMGQISEVARRTVQSIHEFEKATTHLRSSVEGLNAEICQFKT
ncbi:chemotaxis protein : Methyl-accepting chemotaxis protein OS=Singulisphaera acidiphila (strain ATCC BAA-1392 / DSM 18658 / VKM B-2454 / MOB10) GN=Sinac_4835 PE=4 SV=1: HAMP: MCPsignal [Gemmataceae bacterium]|nr:chemotaxis protein : Methyl-accepting chemotaxis protein OS=Singulisphaera acidiphila (strain ATCC BAA-1392 / DSM 18658 / VKM B-2454 / MOB10) GN=Sinac_4835 PE=4 SV=1: HAMP: MCPsignal [Gemmataceae bacterium]VTT98500.1 chemotaxis protein : Methyl-accepting chemotaxis protein OS=Singulisphaera acidiphila (strain ATCC BAA-1392 / DSM 18658 / VKM B-2454 / MOB10) GN=Sinac_4835 PE=4 SV=1: HAMP: MCPsignal [Gemmataceae bacterium]